MGPASTRAVDAVVIGAGHSGLAMSHCLDALGIGHVVLERGQVANSWRTERWDSLRLLTPNWQARLPGFAYAGPEPDGFMRVDELVNLLDAYAAKVAAPIQLGTTVTAVAPLDGGYQVQTDRGAWQARTVVAASGGFNLPRVPALAAGLPAGIRQFTTHDYRNPEQLEPGSVLVVGASATGLQLAEEIHRSGRPVTLAVGEHVRLPRNYRGRDIEWWMHAAGVLDERYDQVDDIVRARHVPSPQLVGSPEHRTLDLNALTDQGVRLVGRLAGLREGRALFSGGLHNVCALADLKMNRLLNTIDEWIAGQGLEQQCGSVERFAATRVDPGSPLGLDLANGEFKSVVWATGLRPDLSWLQVPVLDRKGMPRHDGGVMAAPGLYVLGLPFLRRRKSSFIHGAEDDARELSEHLLGHLRGEHASKANLP